MLRNSLHVFQHLIALHRQTISSLTDVHFPCLDAAHWQMKCRIYCIPPMVPS